MKPALRAGYSTGGKTMRIVRSTALAALAAALLASPALAKDPTESPLQKQLESAQNQLAAKASATKGAPEQEFLMKKQRIDQLINELEAGRSVDPREVQEALENTNQPF